MSISTPENTESKPNLDAALSYLGLGWAVTPVHTPNDEGGCSCSERNSCHSPGKHPRHPGWQRNPIKSEASINANWAVTPWVNIGIVTGKVSGLFVLDVDPAHGGDHALAALETVHGPLPATIEAITGGKGRHLYFKHPGFDVANSAGKIGLGLDVRGEGGFVVAPPSLHVSGSRYEWKDGGHPDQVALAEAPGWLLDLIRKAKPERDHAVTQPPSEVTDLHRRYAEAALEDACDKVRGATEGTRNTTLNTEAFCIGQLIAAGALDGDEATSELLKAAEISGLHESEALPTIERALDDGAVDPRDLSQIGTENGKTYPLTEGGNAERLVDQHGQNIRYCPSLGWLAWDGRRWYRDEGQVAEWAKCIIRDLRRERDAAIKADEPIAKELGRHFRNSDKAAGIAGMLKMASSDPRIRVEYEALDADEWLLNVANGTVDLRTGTLGPHRREDLITKVAPVEFDPSATCPTWLRFLSEIMGGNEALVSYLQRAVGYSLTGSTRDHVFFICYGNGRNGKSVFLNSLLAMLKDYADETPAETLVVKNYGSGIPNDLARLNGVRFVSANETEDGQRLAEAKIKAMTGGDSIPVRFMRGEWFTLVPVWKVWLRTNYRPKVRGTDAGIWDRLMLIPFEVYISEEKRDPELPAKLKAEMPGILAWAVQGCRDWLAQGLNPPPEVKGATAEYRAEMDTVTRFLDAQEKLMTVESSEFYAQYKGWCEVNGEHGISQTAFGRRLTDLGWGKRKRRCGIERTPPERANPDDAREGEDGKDQDEDGELL